MEIKTKSTRRTKRKIKADFQLSNLVHIICQECKHVTMIKPGIYGVDTIIENECDCVRSAKKPNEKNKITKDNK